MRVLATVPLRRQDADEAGREVLRAGTLSATLFRYASGIEALRIRNGRGSLVLLPWFGQMIWDAAFDGVDLCMRSGFEMPLPAASIAGTYGCFLFHSGLLRNGVPGDGDTHAAHGEFPCADMRAAFIELGEDDAGLRLRVVSERDHVEGFGPHYLASPSVTLHEHSGLFEVALSVENRSGRQMELMYMCHVNFSFVDGGRIVQPLPFTPERTQVRRNVPAHVTPDADYLASIETLAEDPAALAVLDGRHGLDPEQVFYLRAPGVDADGRTAVMLRRPEGDGFVVRYAPAELPHLVRWLLDDPDQSVAAFALPATCEPEGYAAEKRKNHVRVLPPHGSASFGLTMGYLDRRDSERMAAHIAGLTTGEPA